MHDRGDAMGLERCRDLVCIVKIALDQRAPTHRLAMPARQVVIDNGPVSGGGQSFAGMTADITGPARD
jgi:hypothetical protein